MKPEVNGYQKFSKICVTDVTFHNQRSCTSDYQIHKKYYLSSFKYLYCL